MVRTECSGRGEKRRVNKIVQMAVRLSSGRSVSTLLRLMSCGLLHADTGQPDASLEPVPGLTATLENDSVFILARFESRGKPFVDVVRLVAKAGPASSTHTFEHSSLLTCAAGDVCDVRFMHRVNCIKRRRVWLSEVVAQDGEIGRKLVCEAIEKNHQLDSRPRADPIPEVSFNLVVSPKQVQPRAALHHATILRHRVAPRECLRGKSLVVWGLPWPVELDCRPWRCESCRRCKGSGHQFFAATTEDIQAAVPGTLVHHSSKIGRVMFTSRFLLQYFLVLYETLCFRAARRRLLDVFVANALAVAGKGACSSRLRLVSLLGAFPTAAQLQAIALKAFPELVRQQVRAMQSLQYVYNGQGIRLDGHWKKASIICRYKVNSGSAQKLERPYSCLMGFAGVDGSLLAPVVPIRAEVWDEVEAVLKPIVADLVSARMRFGLSAEQAVPVYIATDSYAKHFRKMQKMMQEVCGQLRLQPHASTPRGPAANVAITPCENHPVDDLTTITGEPFHDVINLRKVVSVKANDAVDLIYDHTDMMSRLSAVEPPPRRKREELPALSQAARELLLTCVTKQVATFRAALDSRPDLATEVRQFLSSPDVRAAKDVWKSTFGAQPPRGVLARLARRFGAKLPDSCGFFNYRTQKGFEAAVKRLRRWYKVGRRISRSRTGLLRIRSTTSLDVRGTACVATAKVETKSRDYGIGDAALSQHMPLE